LKSNRNKPARILLTIPNFDSAGSGKVVYDLAKQIDKELFEVHIACSNDKGPFFKLVSALDVTIHITNTTCSYRPYISLPSKIFKIAGFFKKNHFDLIHSWHWSSDWTEPLAAKIAGIKWIYTKKAMSWGSPRNWKIRSRLASFITTINPDMRKLYFNKFNNIRMLPLGLDTNYYSFQPKTFQYKEITFQQNDFVIISVVNLIKSKGLEVLVDAMKFINEPTVKLLVVGDYSSEYGQHIFNKVKSENLDSRIIFTGKVLDVRSYIALADVFVTPTNVNWEGMPMAPVEAMASGRIVIGTDTSGINFILDDFKDFLIPPNNPAAIAEKILMVKSMTPDKKNELQWNYRRKAIDAFAVETFATNYQKLYQELINA